MVRSFECVAASWRRSRLARAGDVVLRWTRPRGPVRSRGGDAGVQEARPAATHKGGSFPV